MSRRKTSPSRNQTLAAVWASRNVMTSREVVVRRILTHLRARRGSTLFMGIRPTASSCLAKLSSIAICVKIIRTLRLRHKSRALTPVLRPGPVSMGTTTLAATLTRTWSVLMYQWANQAASHTHVCFTFHNKVTRQIIWFSLLLAFPIMIDNTLSVSVLSAICIDWWFSRKINQRQFLLNSDVFFVY